MKHYFEQFSLRDCKQVG